MRRLLAALTILAACPGAADKTTQVGHGCHGNALEACYYYINGPITQGVTDEFTTMLDKGSFEGFKVLLNSTGGDLNAGLMLGRAIRVAGLQTRIGIYNDREHPDPGECLSACAYAFLGGTQRVLREGDRIGFHQFALDGGTARLSEGTGGLIIGQQLSATVIAYMVEMGVDARLFTIASETPFSQMYYPDEAQRLEYDVETPLGFDHFFMEPYGDGVIAASKRRGRSHFYDRVNQMTVYCRDGTARVLLTGKRGNLSAPPPTDLARLGVEVAGLLQPRQDQWQGITPTARDVRTWLDETGVYVEIAFDPSQVPISDAARLFSAYLTTSRSMGGYYGAQVELNEMDRQMLRAAFRMCV